MYRILFLIAFSLFSQIASSQDYVISEINIEGNKITKDFIILKELDFAKGDTIDIQSIDKRLERGQQNVFNTSLFNTVTISYSKDNDKIIISILVEERWYTWPYPIVKFEDRNFSDWWQHKSLDRVSIGAYLQRFNMRGRNETLQIDFQLGYSQEIGLFYKIPYLIKKRNQGLTIAALYVRRHEIYHKTIDDNLIFIKDEDNFLRQEFKVETNYTFRSSINNTHYFIAGYDNINVADTVVSTAENPDYLGRGTSKDQFITLGYRYRIDHRRSKNYPLTGYFVDLQAKKYGINLLAKEVDNFSIDLTLRKFIKIHDGLFYAIGAKGTVVSPNTSVPFYLFKGLGFDDFVRGYEPFVITGASYFTVKQNLKFQLIKPSSYKMKFIPLEKFNNFQYALYLNSFFDLGYIDNPFSNSKMTNELLTGFGVGLDFVTYYDLVSKIELSFDKNMTPRINLGFKASI